MLAVLRSFGHLRTSLLSLRSFVMNWHLELARESPKKKGVVSVFFARTRPPQARTSRPTDASIISCPGIDTPLAPNYNPVNPSPALGGRMERLLVLSRRFSGLNQASPHRIAHKT